jgi:hypothetical protein
VNEDSAVTVTLDEQRYNGAPRPRSSKKRARHEQRCSPATIRPICEKSQKIYETIEGKRFPKGYKSWENVFAK